MRTSTSTIHLLASFIAITFLSVGPLHGQTLEQAGKIFATGQHELKVAPQKLRLTLTIQAQGTDAQSAVRKLAEHKERVKQELVELKAEEASIEFGATQVSSGVGGMPPEWQQYGARMMAQLAQQTPEVSAENLPQVSTAAATVRADWPLPTTDFDALALLPNALQEQVKARDLRGEKNKAELDASQQERLEEMQTAMQEQMGYYGGQDAATAFGVLFVAPITEEDRRAALRAAYEQAIAQAEMLAGVTGKQLGNLVSLRATGGLAADSPTAAYAAAMAAASGTPGPASTADEITAASPDQLKLSVGVEAEFHLAH